jgi:non-heme chloroperoxidase
MGSFTTARCNPGLLDLWDSAVSRIADPIDPAFVLEFQESTLAKPVSQAFLHTVVQESLKVPAHVWRAALGDLLAADHSAELRTIRAPTRIVWGDRDSLFPRRYQEALATAIAGSQLLVYPGAGHALHWEKPDRFAADLTAFAESLVG